MTRGMIQLGATLAMLVTVLGGAAAARETAPPTNGMVRVHRLSGARDDLGLTVSVSATTDGSLLLSATAGDLAVRKVVYPDGRFHVQIEQGRDRVALTGAVGRVSVTYGSRSLTLTPDRDDDQQGRRVRELLAASPSLRLFRRLNAELEASGDITPEMLGLRLTGALVAEIDGDEGAVRRLSRELMAKYGANMKRASTLGQYPPSCWDIYTQQVTKASYQLEQCLGQFGLFNPMRQLCPFYWTLQVESFWFSLLGCSAVPLPGR